MDLKAVKCKLVQGGYTDQLQELVADTRLVFQNCLEYNAAGDVYHGRAERLLALATELFGDVDTSAAVPPPAAAAAATTTTTTNSGTGGTKRKSQELTTGAAKVPRGEAAATAAAAIGAPAAGAASAAAAVSADSSDSDSDADSSDEDLLAHPFKSADELAAQAQERKRAMEAKRASSGGASFEQQYKEYRAGQKKMKAEATPAATSASGTASANAAAAAAAGGAEDEPIDLTDDRAKICKALFEIEEASFNGGLSSKPTPSSFKPSFGASPARVLDFLSASPSLVLPACLSLALAPASSDPSSSLVCVFPELMQHQKQALAWMLNREEGVGITHGPCGGILADDMGLGKTASCLSVITSDYMSARAQGKVLGPTLIVCPTSVVDSWEGEILLRFTPAFRPRWSRYYGDSKPSLSDIQRSELVITTYGSLLSRKVPLRSFKTVRANRSLAQSPT
jgi:hypothetical protein